MNAALEKMLTELERTGFYGRVEIEYQSGRPTLIRKTQTTKLYQESYDGRPNKETR